MKTFKLLLIISLLLSLTGCEEKREEAKNKETQSKARKNEKVTSAAQSHKRETLSENNNSEENRTVEEKHSFFLSDMNDVNHSVTIENKTITISDISEPIIVLNFFATWCPPCQGEIPYLADLQKKYEGKLFIAALLVNDKPGKEALKIFLKEYGVNYYVSTGSDNDNFAKLAIEKLHLPKDLPLPLTVLFKEGHYYSHYEGAVPVEMLEHDIKNAMPKE